MPTAEWIEVSLSGADVTPGGICVPHRGFTAGVCSDRPVAMLCLFLKIFNIAPAWVINLVSAVMGSQASHFTSEF